nr:MAG TPA: hypothetical protein [Caudoviricetes sp.]
MTNAEAKELLAHKLRQIIDHWDGTEETKLLGDALAVAVSAIDRATPKKVKPYEKNARVAGKASLCPGCMFVERAAVMRYIPTILPS